MEVTIHLGSSGEPCSTLKVFSQTDQGDRPDNQDMVAHRCVGDYWIGVVADGAGGHSGGKMAAQIVTQGVLDQFSQEPSLCPLRLRGLLESTNLALRGAQCAHPEYSNMHSTVSCLIIHRPTRQAIWLHVGDTRIYHFRDGVCLSQSKDHSVLRHALYSAMGQSPDELVIDSLQTPVNLCGGDCLLMCTDGVWESFSNTELALMQVVLVEPERLLPHVHELALRRAVGRSDNLTSLAVVVV